MAAEEKDQAAKQNKPNDTEASSQNKANPSQSAPEPAVQAQIGFGGLFKGLSNMVNLISDMADKAQQAEQQGETRSGQYQSGDRERGFVVSWAFNSGTLADMAEKKTDFGSRPSPFVRPTSRPAPSSSRPNPATGRKPTRSPLNSVASEQVPTLREPYTEIHDEVEAGQVVIVIELPDVDPEKVQLEVFDDVLIVRAEGPYCRYEKEILLPVMVEPEPESCNFQNGLFEIRLRRQKI